MSDFKPKNFLFATWEGGGAVPPFLHVAEKMVRRGHRVRVMSDACNRLEAEATGATFIPWAQAPSKRTRDREEDTFNDWDAPTPFDGLLQLIDAILAGPALAFAQDLIAELRREPADLVVSSEMLFGVPMACEAIGQKIVLLPVNINLWPTEGFPPLGPGLMPATNDAERALHAEIAEATIAGIDRWLPGFNAARATLGLAPLKSIFDQHRVSSATLLATSRAFDFVPEVLPPHLAYVGPQLGEPAWAKPWHSPFAPGDARPLALVAFSTTFQNHAGVVQRVVDAIGGLAMKAVVTLGSSLRPGEIRPADNVALVESAPHGAILREASLVVTHGGHGTVMKSLAAQRPMLIIPHGRDQNDNAVRVTARGAGLSLPLEADTATIRAALARLLTEPAFAEAARDLGARVAQEAAESPVAATLEALAMPAPIRCAA